MGLLRYVQQRWKLICCGFLVGLAAGYGRTLVFGPDDLPESARWVLATQIAFCFAMLALFISNYLELRKRVIKKAHELQSREKGER